MEEVRQRVRNAWQEVLRAMDVVLLTSVHCLLLHM